MNSVQKEEIEFATAVIGLIGGIVSLIILLFPISTKPARVISALVRKFFKKLAGCHVTKRHLLFKKAKSVYTSLINILLTTLLKKLECIMFTQLFNFLKMLKREFFSQLNEFLKNISALHSVTQYKKTFSVVNSHNEPENFIFG